ncbi:hypothetical protein L5515_018259 [Caenorhabditis briggsae]|uniref:Uncharacterized protein n=1 Tax=Caenorhabditis briggsae TaxID=6238 RepID=A0AAE9JS08_CAEBR|nr:hypothetical protein L5515_018259 [Caenorhabditis briggsae]
MERPDADRPISGSDELLSVQVYLFLMKGAFASSAPNIHAKQKSELYSIMHNVIKASTCDFHKKLYDCDAKLLTTKKKHIESMTNVGGEVATRAQFARSKSQTMKNQLVTVKLETIRANGLILRAKEILLLKQRAFEKKKIEIEFEKKKKDLEFEKLKSGVSFNAVFTAIQYAMSDL